MLKKEIQDQAASCMAEAERLRKDADRREHNLDLTEKEAEEYLKVFSWSVFFYCLETWLLSIYTLLSSISVLDFAYLGSIVCWSKIILKKKYQMGHRVYRSCQ